MLVPQQVDITGAAASEDERRGRIETSIPQYQPLTGAENTTHFITAPTPHLYAQQLGTQASANYIVSVPDAIQINAHDPSIVDNARDQRLTLLARKYEGMESAEDDARFKLLTERLRRLVPRIVDGDMEILDAVVSDLEVSASLIDELRTKHGLR